jgi:pimeloyl-ACP methyl ester carboxylesterase
MALSIGHETGTVAVEGGQIYYEAMGSGHALVLTHAGVANHRMWDDQFNVFAQHYRVIRYDVRGVGQSSDSDRPFAFYQDLHDLLRHLGITQAHVLGLSMGGGISLAFTLAYPEMVSALVLAASGPGGREPSPLLTQVWEQVDAAAERGDYDEANDLEVRLWVDGPGRTPDQVDSSVRERIREWNREGFTRPGGEGKPQPLDPPVHTRLGEIHVPTLVIVGDQDVPDVLASSDVLATGIPGARKVVIPGTAHMLNMEQPAEFNRLVLDFLGTL